MFNLTQTTEYYLTYMRNSTVDYLGVYPLIYTIK